MKKSEKKYHDTESQSGINRHGLYISILVFGLIFAVFLATLLVLFPNMPVIARLAENIPGYDRTYPPFRVDEYNYHTIAENILNGSVYEENSLERNFTIGFPLVASPFIAIMGEIGGYIANVFIIWLSIVVFYMILRRYCSRSKALIFSLIMAFATLNWFYAASCYTEPLSQLLINLSFYFLLLEKRSKRLKKMLILAGVACGLNLFVRPHFILLTIPFFLYLWIEMNGKVSLNNRAFLFGAGVGVVILIWFARNSLVFDSPFSFEYSKLTASFSPMAESSYMKGNVFLGIHRLLFDQYHGLLTITPLFLLFPAGLRSMWLKGLKKESLTLLAAIVLMALFIASGPYPFTEFGLGSRHMVPILPLMLFPSAFFLDGKLFSRTIVIVLTVYSFYHAGIGWFTGEEPGMSFFLGILNESQSRTVILARKDLLPEKEFNSQEEILNSFLKALKKADLMKLLQTLDPAVIKKIKGNERNFMLFLRSQKNPASFIKSADPWKGIIVKDFSISGRKNE